MYVEQPKSECRDHCQSNDDVCDTTHMQATHQNCAGHHRHIGILCDGYLVRRDGFTSQALLPPDTALLPTNPACATTARQEPPNNTKAAKARPIHFQNAVAAVSSGLSPASAEK